MRRAHAFTLVELMAVLVTAGALAVVATSTRPAYWQRTRRAVAGAALGATLSQPELRHARTGTYDSGNSQPPSPMPKVDGYLIFAQECISLDTNVPLSECGEVIASPIPPDPVCPFPMLCSTGERIPDNPACWP